MTNMIGSFFGGSPGSPRRKKSNGGGSFRTKQKNKIRPRPTSKRQTRQQQHQQQLQEQQEKERQQELDDLAVIDDVLSNEDMNVAETVNGIEVSLDFIPQPFTQVVDYFHFTKKASKVHRSQFRMDIPLFEKLPVEKNKTAEARIKNNHRVPLLNKPDQQMSLQDMVFMLQAHKVTDEIASVKAEIKKLDKEVEAVESDRGELEQEYLCIPAQEAQHNAWDIDYMLKYSSEPSEKHELQRLRGRCLTIQLKNPKSLDHLCAKLGSKATKRKVYQTRVTVTPKDSTTIAALSHLSLLPANTESSSSSTPSAAYFLHFDNKERSEGLIPPRLFRKMKKFCLGTEMLKYLATGPGGTYYASFTSGHIWWYVDDPQFSILAKEWNVYRVAFGETVRLGDTGKTVSTWFIIHRDGRVAYRNIPQPLQSLLEARLANQPCPSDVSFGSDGAYFVRFLDGQVDYCLPAHSAEMCQWILRRGGKITSVVMHPQLSKDVVIRHTELRS